MCSLVGVSVCTCLCVPVCARVSVCVCPRASRSAPTAHTGLLSCSPGPTTLQSAAARLRVIGEVWVTKPDAWLILHFSRVCRLRSWPLRPSRFKERDSPCPSAAGMGQRGTGMMVSRGLTSYENETPKKQSREQGQGARPGSHLAALVPEDCVLVKRPETATRHSPKLVTIAETGLIPRSTDVSPRDRIKRPNYMMNHALTASIISET